MTNDTFLPATNGALTTFVLPVQPSRTYRLDITHGRVRGMTQDVEALIQAIYLILSVERYRYPIYSRDYGAELSDLIGCPKDYAMSEVKRRITEALIQDDRIDSVDGWNFESTKRALTVTFTVHSIYGDIEATKEVDI